VTWTSLHVFESRSSAFQDDDVLQENIVFAVTKGRSADVQARVSTSPNATEPDGTIRFVSQASLVDPKDPEAILHLPINDQDVLTRDLIRSLDHSLVGLGLTVSTGRVVDFRARSHLRNDIGPQDAPLIQPHNLIDGRVVWPRRRGNKPVAIEANAETSSQLVPDGWYVLVKRFTSKEQRRRVVAAVLEPSRGSWVGFENHLNFIHQRGAGIPANVALGLSAYLNSTLVDAYVRQFSGHTQVNAADLRRLPLPSLRTLGKLGETLGSELPEQANLDLLVETTLWPNSAVRRQPRVQTGASPSAAEDRSGWIRAKT